MHQPAQPYPKPGPIGGRLIRDVIAFMRNQGVQLPLSSHILIATSGGSDSVALAHLMTHFGRRVVAPSRISLLHINHGWRGNESDLDELFVKDLGKRWGVPVLVQRLKPPKEGLGQSLEDEAREARKKIYDRLAKKHEAVVLTAHQADDLAETLLWRLFTGAAQTHGGGVAFRHGVEIRPFLTIRKPEIKKYLQEVREIFREDATNFSDRFLRARMRSRLMPEAEKIFPRVVQHLGKLALQAQAETQRAESGMNPLGMGFDAPSFLIHAAGLKVRRPHLTLIFEKLVAKRPWYGEIHLPGGWKLIREKNFLKSESSSKGRSIDKKVKSSLERWILERT
jgi:tRNA(Ile)-lysidine synthetase-like protein